MSQPSRSPESTRERITRASRPLIVQLNALPKWVVPVATVVLVGIGALAPLAIAAVALTAVFVFVAWIAYLAWPVITTSGRALRIVMLALIVGIGLSHLL